MQWRAIATFFSIVLIDFICRIFERFLLDDLLRGLRIILTKGEIGQSFALKLIVEFLDFLNLVGNLARLFVL